VKWHQKNLRNQTESVTPLGKAGEKESKKTGNKLAMKRIAKKALSTKGKEVHNR